MSDFIINPPVHLRAQPETAIRSLDEAAAVVRRFARDHRDTRAESVLHRLEGATGLDQEAAAALAFRAWAESAGLLLIPNENQ